MSVSTEENKAQKHSAKKRIITVLSAAAAVVLLITAAFLIIIKTGESKLRESAENNSAGLPADGGEIPENADAYYNGKAYNYNDRLINILLIGVDRVSPFLIFIKAKTFASCGTRQGLRPLTPPPFEKGGRKLLCDIFC